jgi:DNA polymerase III subunit gamma/tau
MLPDDAAAQAEAQARRMGPAALVRAMETVGQALIDMREAADPRTTLEVALVRLSDPDIDHSNAALLARIERLEQTLGARAGAVLSGSAARVAAPVSEGASPPRATASSPESSRSIGPPPPLPAPAPPAPTPEAKSALGAHRRPRSTAAEVSDPPVEQVPAVSPPAPSAPPAAPLPSRDELTLAWGDQILPSLRPAVKVYVASGRFLSVGDTAVYAVPDKGLLGRAQAGRAEVEAALSAHFGRPIPLELVLDEGGRPAPAEAALSATDIDADDPADYRMADLEDAPAGVMSPEQRLLEAFPGAEEV